MRPTVGAAALVPETSSNGDGGVGRGWLLRSRSLDLFDRTEPVPGEDVARRSAAKPEAVVATRAVVGARWGEAAGARYGRRGARQPGQGMDDGGARQEAAAAGCGPGEETQRQVTDR